jgi:RNA polymerase subunit RPABC4/transcription elongation factor Spt4
MYTLRDEEIKNNISTVTSFSELANKLGISRSMASKLKIRCVELRLDYSHFRVSGYKPHDLKDLTSRRAIKKYLIREGILEYKCYKCSIVNWNDLPIILDLEHIDGNTNNNDINNLILLCPNCHSQTSTFKGRNKRNKRNNVD